MSSPLKRKRDNTSTTNSSRSPQPLQRSAQIFHDPSSTTTLRSKAAEQGDLQAQLKLSLVDLQASSSRIESILRQLGTSSSSSRNALAEVTAPTQPQAAPTEKCSSCSSLQSRIRELEEKAAAHEKEKEAWKAFKSWWLQSLDKRERLHQQQQKRRKKVKSIPNGVSEADGERETEAGISGVVSKLDAETKGVWERAGIIPPPEDGAEGSRRREPSSGAGAESAGQQSELTLPLAAPVAAALPSLPPVPPSTTAATIRSAHNDRREVGYIDSTPIRSRVARRSMIANDCPDCQLFYSHFNDLDRGLGDRERMACSRHRTTFERATTPDGYWNIGFPTTQEVEEINQSARRERLNKATSNGTRRGQ